MRVYTASNRRDSVVMVTVFPGQEVCRSVEATYPMHVKHIDRAEMTRWFRYWRRCGWDVRRVV
jgi:hypothetical protein